VSGLYNSFLASGAPSELNIDHGLRNKLDSRMIQTDDDPDSMRYALTEVVDLFEQAQTSVFKLMASDSVPKFVRDPRYAHLLREHESDLIATGGRGLQLGAIPDRSTSRATPSRPT
jgi:GTPase-activating protein SST2